MVVELRLGRARTTKDVDLGWGGSSDGVLDSLQEAGRSESEDHMQFEIELDSEHPRITTPGTARIGQRFRAQAMLGGKKYGDGFGIDVVFDEPATETADIVLGTDVLAFLGIERTKHRVYTVERHVAENVHAYTRPTPRPNTRLKDWPDIALLATVRDLEADALADALKRTFAERATHELPNILPAPPTDWVVRYARMAEVDDLPWRTLVELEEAVRAFVDPILAGTRAAHWGRSESRWITVTTR